MTSKTSTSSFGSDFPTERRSELIEKLSQMHFEIAIAAKPLDGNFKAAAFYNASLQLIANILTRHI